MNFYSIFVVQCLGGEILVNTMDLKSIGPQRPCRFKSDPRYKMFKEQVSSLDKTVDEIIIPGDIFDKLPSLEEQEVYWDFISDLTSKVIISTGNHESTKKGKSFFSNLKRVSENLNPNVEIVVDYIKECDDYYVVPYEFIKQKHTWDSLNSNKYVFTHFRASIPPHVKPEIPLEWVEKFPIVFAGDLHSHSNSQGNIVYPGSPMTTSFHRSKVDTGYIIIDDNWNWKFNKFELPQLIRKTVSSEDEIIPTEYDHTIYELEGNLKELSKVKNTDGLLDKKLVKRAVADVSLVLNRDMSMRDKLFEYLSYILEIDDKEVLELLSLYDEYGVK